MLGTVADVRFGEAIHLHVDDSSGARPMRIASFTGDSHFRAGTAPIFAHPIFPLMLPLKDHSARRRRKRRLPTFMT